MGSGQGKSGYLTLARKTGGSNNGAMAFTEYQSTGSGGGLVFGDLTAGNTFVTAVSDIGSGDLTGASSGNLIVQSISNNGFTLRSTQQDVGDSILTITITAEGN